MRPSKDDFDYLFVGSAIFVYHETVCLFYGSQNNLTDFSYYFCIA